MKDKIEQQFQKKGLKLTDQRRTIAKVILESKEAYGSLIIRMLMNYIIEFLKLTQK